MKKNWFLKKKHFQKRAYKYEKQIFFSISKIFLISYKNIIY